MLNPVATSSSCGCSYRNMPTESKPDPLESLKEIPSSLSETGLVWGTGQGEKAQVCVCTFDFSVLGALAGAVLITAHMFGKLHSSGPLFLLKGESQLSN